VGGSPVGHGTSSRLTGTARLPPASPLGSSRPSRMAILGRWCTSSPLATILRRLELGLMRPRWLRTRPTIIRRAYKEISQYPAI
jgi:hypothetical protein